MVMLRFVSPRSLPSINTEMGLQIESNFWTKIEMKKKNLWTDVQLRTDDILDAKYVPI